MGRPVTYFDYKPINIYPADNQVPELVNQHGIPVPPAIVPDHIATGANPDQGPFTSAGVEVGYPNNRLYKLYNQAKGIMNLTTTWLFISPAENVRYDNYSQDVQPPRSPGRQKAGNSPTTGVYTGRYELESYSYYGGIQEDYPV